MKLLSLTFALISAISSAAIFQACLVSSDLHGPLKNYFTKSFSTAISLNCVTFPLILHCQEILSVFRDKRILPLQRKKHRADDTKRMRNGK